MRRLRSAWEGGEVIGCPKPQCQRPRDVGIIAASLGRVSKSQASVTITNLLRAFRTPTITPLRTSATNTTVWIGPVSDGTRKITPAPNQKRHPATAATIVHPIIARVLRIPRGIHTSAISVAATTSTMKATIPKSVINRNSSRDRNSRSGNSKHAVSTATPEETDAPRVTIALTGDGPESGLKGTSGIRGGRTSDRVPTLLRSLRPGSKHQLW